MEQRLKGCDLTPEMLRYGYEQGWFPMTTDESADEVEWFRSKRRCLFPIEGVHVSKSLAKRIRKGGFRVTFDTAFEQVVQSCRRGPGHDWISDEFVRVYGEVHRQGWAHSGEVWIDDRLVGGIYGVSVGTVFSAESMFHRETDMSKVALWAMVDWARTQGFTVFDAQIMNPHLRRMGAYEVSDREFMKLLMAGLRG